MSFTSISLALVLSSNTPAQDFNNLDFLGQEQVVQVPSLSANFEESAGEWLERVLSVSESGECYRKVKNNFPACVHVNRSIQTTGWRSPGQNYIMLVNCEKHPEENYISLPASQENTQSEYYCKDSERVWIKRDPVFSDTDANQ